MKAAYIDDNEGDQFLFKRLVKDLDLELTIFTELDDLTGEYDIIFTDLNMHKYWGGESIQKIREKYDCPIVAVSGLGDSAPQKLMAEYVNGYDIQFLHKDSLTTQKIKDCLKS